MNKPSHNKKSAAKDGPKQPREGLKTRIAASEVVYQVLFRQIYLDEALANVIAHYELGPRERGLVRAIVTITLRRLGQIKSLLDKHMKRKLPNKFGLAASILYTSAGQILFMNVPDHAAIDLGVGQMRRNKKFNHIAGMSNAVLRKVMADKDEVLAMPDEGPHGTGRANAAKWLWQIWAKDFGKPVADQIAGAHLNEPSLDITAKRAGFAFEMGDVLPLGSVRMPEKIGRVEDIKGFETGDWWVQDFAASLPAKILAKGLAKGLDESANSKVLDLCAAPGGKTMQLASMGNDVTALDVSENRLERVSENLERVGLNAEIICADALEWTPEQVFDGILLDAPCSATGTIRRHPDAQYLKKSSDIDALVKLQAELLSRAASFVKAGGVLLYCTCSLQKREGELQVAKFLDENENFERLPVGADELDGLDHLINDEGDVRTLPFYQVGESYGMDGFFISRLRRKV